jgi:hypothetical protein
MLRWTMMALLALATTAAATDGTHSTNRSAIAMNAATPGRTDGPEGSEYGKGGYGRFRSEGRLYAEGFFGSAIVHRDDGVDADQTDLFGGLYVGYRMENWLGFQVGYARIADQNTSLWSAGTRSVFDADPFAYYVALDAEIYAPEVGESAFGIAPGAGIEVLLTERIRAGLRIQRDLIFSDESIGINRLGATIRLDF